MELSKEFRWEASHQIHNHPGRCSQLHGHSWVLTVFVEGPINSETGMVQDFYEIKKAVQPIIDRLDHTHLGSGNVQWHSFHDGPEPEGDNIWLGPSHEPSLPKLPTSENLLYWIAEQFPHSFKWSKMTINETCTSSATLTAEEYGLCDI